MTSEQQQIVSVLLSIFGGCVMLALTGLVNWLRGLNTRVSDLRAEVNELQMAAFPHESVRRRHGGG
jgi:hypothetical protein